MRRVWPIITLTVFVAYGLWAVTQAPNIVRAELEQRSDAIAAQDVLRRGTVRVTTLSLDQPSTDLRTRVAFRIFSPHDPAEDTEIRGLLDGSVKHRYNQGTAFHIRMGRRYSGMFSGQFELKRGLYRWKPPALPPRGRVVSARVCFWAEGFFRNSPLAEGEGLPLHVYAYPLTDDWGAGLGGVDRNTLSEAAPGEANWLMSRAGQRVWPAPGALSPEFGEDGSGEWPRPLAVARVESAERQVVLRGAGLQRYVDECLRQGRSVDLLLKLDDADEDRYGTQFAFITSDFGDDGDLPSRRPRLEYDVEIPSPGESVDHGFVLEAGQEWILPRRAHAGRTLIAAEVLDERAEGVIPPEIWVRGGAEPGTGEWERLVRPVIREWAWSEVKISAAPRRVAWGEPFRLEIFEPWVKPGPREVQVPQYLVVAPSGRRQILAGRPGEGLEFIMEFTPDEPGLWKYGWSFLCESISAPFSHQGQGLFYVDASGLADEESDLEIRARALIASFEGRSYQTPADQVRVNAFIRQASRHALRSPEARARSEALIGEVTGALPGEFRAN